MGWIDSAKRFRQKIVDTTLPPPVVFHHVPKCGGTSVGRALRKRYLLSQATVHPESSFRAFAAFSGRDDRERLLVDVLDLREQMLLYNLYEGVRCVSAHVRFSEPAYELFSHSYAFITILREPVSRFISNYLWSHGKPYAHGRIEEDLLDFLDTPRAKRMGATYVEFYSGFPKDAEMSSEEAIYAAQKNLAKFDVVGRLDDLPTFRLELKRRLGINVRIGHENRMRQSQQERKRILSEDVVARVQELCLPDRAVWESIMVDSVV